jgi:hypothetical protein
MAYTTIDDPSAHFQTATYTGNGSTQSITNDGHSDLQPDLIWAKNRNDAYDNVLGDSTRGAGLTLISNSTSAEVNEGTNGLTSFDSDGFSLGGNSGGWNFSSAKTYVAWQWKANAGSTSSNTDGNITTTVQSNADAGFNILTYTGNGTANQTIGHNLGVTPDVWIFKRRDAGSSWVVGASDSSFFGGTSNFLILNGTNTIQTSNNIFGASPANSTLMRVGSQTDVNASGGTYVCYAFAQKQGYSKFGTYEGTGFGNGPYIYTGFKPAFVLMKNCNTVDNWILLDNKRDGYNPTEKYLMPSSSSAESTNVDAGKIDIYSNGFRIVTSYQSINKGSDKIFYMAFAENPFVTSTGIPTTAR